MAAFNSLVALQPLVRRVRVLALQGAELANINVDTLRIKLLKVVAAMVPNSWCIRQYLVSSWPSGVIPEHAVRQLRSL